MIMIAAVPDNQNILKHRMRNRVVIIQTNYIPWKGYFDLLSHADTVVYLDSVQSTKNDWRNRNQIKTHAGKTWLTIPVQHSNQLRIREVTVSSTNWHHKHYRTLSQSYARAPYASELLQRIEEWYREAGEHTHLSEINRVFLRHLTSFLDISPRIHEAEAILPSEEHDNLEPTQRLVEICKRLGATSYLSGPAASLYLNEDMFRAESIGVEWFDYDGYSVYPQLHGQFDHAVSILDLILMVGADARNFAVRMIPLFKEKEVLHDR